MAITKKTIKKALDVNYIKSIVGERQFNQEIVAAIQSGIPIAEAPELIARRMMRDTK
jgi:hypothetical protein